MIGRVIGGLCVVIVVAFLGFYAWAWHGEIAPVAEPAGNSFDPAIVRKGAELAAVGSCATCHTKPGGPAFAGGYPVQTPFGTIYGSNITPDPQTGIGSWSEAAFHRALREGVGRKGTHFYPAFPYDHFTLANDGDISALYAFLMTRQPVHQQNRRPDIVFPLNFRLFAAAWKLLFLHRGPYQPDASKDQRWNRGAYLVKSFGHCSACHTPRNALGAEVRDSAFNGGTAEGWRAPALNASSPAPVRWTEEQVYSYLRTGFADQHGHVAGPMQPVAESLHEAPDADLHAMATYIASLTQGPDADKRTQAALDFAQSRDVKVSGKAATTGTMANDHAPGADIFAGACATCHHEGGALPISRPVPLALTTTVNETHATNFLRIVLAGIHPSPGRRGAIMPAFDGALTDAQIVALAIYVRSHYSRQSAWSDLGGQLKAARANPEPKAGTP